MSMDTHLPADAEHGKSSASSPEPVSIPQPSLAEQKRRRGEPLQAGDPVTAADLMDDHIVRRLEDVGVIKVVAKQLGVSARTVSRRVEKRKLVYRKFPRRGKKLQG
jgi:hypothetical protein